VFAFLNKPPVALGLDDSLKSETLENMAAGTAKNKVQERLENLLSPEAKSLSMTINCGPGKPGKKVKEAVTTILDKYVSILSWFRLLSIASRFKLLDYTTDNGRISIIDVPEDQLPAWLVAYRIAATQPEDEDEFGWGRY